MSKDAEIGARVRALREAQGKSLAEVCGEAGEVSGLNASRLSMKERGQMGWSAEQIAAVAPVLGTTPGALFGDTDGEDTDPVPEQAPDDPVSVAGRSM